VVLAPNGSVAFSVGDVTDPIFPRSSNKPMQAAGMLHAGLDIKDELLALAAASHSGEDFHVEGVRSILDWAGLTEEDLQCPPDPTRIRMNCSGKHAAMLATCVANGWPTQTYRDPDHPLQRRIKNTVEKLAGEQVTTTGVDGCGAPLFALSLIGLARAFHTLVLAEPVSPERRVVDAMRAHPEWTSGTQRDENRLMRAVPGLLDKGGAEGVDAFALANGYAGAVKFDDGSSRARTAVTVALLRKIGKTVPDDLGHTPVLGAGLPVGEIRPII
jgi:L-asparaginase II